jgi:uncharacterized protein (DUF58 family)
MWTSRINYLILIALILAGLIFYNNYALLMVLVIVIIMPFVSLILSVIGKKKINIGLSVDKASVGKSVPIDVYFDIENKSFVPVENFTLNIRIFNNFYDNEETYELIVPSTPMGKRRMTIKVSSIYCGRLVVEIDSATMYDVFGIFKFRLSSDVKAETMIMPYETVELDNIPISAYGNADDEDIQYVKGDDVSQISEIRNYIPGDKLQNIHWKLSAKSEELQVKEYSLPYSDDVTLLIELFVNKEMPELFDEMIEKIFAISCNLIKQGRKFNVEWFDKKLEDFDYREINNSDELLETIIDLYYSIPEEINGSTYDMYRKINGEIKGTVLYLCDRNIKVAEGNEIDIETDKVVLICLS